MTPQGEKRLLAILEEMIEQNKRTHILLDQLKNKLEQPLTIKK